MLGVVTPVASAFLNVSTRLAERQAAARQGPPTLLWEHILIRCPPAPGVTPSSTLTAPPPPRTPYLSAAKRPAARCGSLPFSSRASASMRFAMSSSSSLILRRTPRDSGPPSTADRVRAHGQARLRPAGHLKPPGGSMTPTPVPLLQAKEASGE